MRKIQNETLRATRDYVRSGGKTNRRQQLKRMLVFVTFAKKNGAIDLNNIGKKHVIRYYKTNRHLANTTLLSHYYAIRTLFMLTHKPEPPIPRFD